jgi:hypothetical protein
LSAMYQIRRRASPPILRLARPDQVIDNDQTGRNPVRFCRACARQRYDRFSLRGCVTAWFAGLIKFLRKPYFATGCGVIAREKRLQPRQNRVL